LSRILIASLLGLMLAAPSPALAADAGSEPIRVGSKKFTESVVLGELLAHLLRASGAKALHRAELGGSRVLWNALQGGEIDAYPEYTGTIRLELLGGRDDLDEAGLYTALRALGIEMSRPLGFNNTYALGLLEARAEELGLTRVSELVAHPALRLGFTSEFMDREDGWPGLRDAYALPQRNVRGLDHDLAYRGLAGGSIDVTDLYSTDADIRYYGLRVLADDRQYFPLYNAVVLYRSDLAERAPAAVRMLRKLEGAISAEAMTRMNARAKIDRVPEEQVAAEFAETLLKRPVERRRRGSWIDSLLQHSAEHLGLVGISLGAAIVLAVPLGIAAAHYARFGQVILALTGVIQTIPSLALLVFMIPLLGIGAPPAVAALFLYSLLPIVRNTYTGLHDIPIGLRESAEALGLAPLARLRSVELPMASRSILAGIKTSAVINIGTATLGALIGAGGYGQPILTGIRLDDTALILQGAVPAAALALVVQGGFELAERGLVPRGLRLPRSE
jgi:osmoprotectant transport system permease protein